MTMFWYCATQMIEGTENNRHDRMSERDRM